MPTPTKGPRLGTGPAHERLMLANLATALFEHGRITTTETKAKRLRPLAERLITFAKRGDLHARRQVLTVVRDKGVVHTLFAEIGPRFAARPGGYTRIVKIGPRKGDNAPMAVIELVEAQTEKKSVVEEAERSRGTRFARGRAGAAKGAAAADQADQANQAGTATDTDTATDTPVEPAGDLTDTAAEPQGPGSAAAPSDGSAPEGYPIKGNADSMKYHTPDSQWYDQTNAEVWFATAEDAERAGFSAPGSTDSDESNPA